MSAQHHENSSENPISLQKGKYVFTGKLTEGKHADASVPFFYAEAIIIAESDGVIKGDILPVNVSDLILKQSSFIDETGRVTEAHKLYVWPRNLGSTDQWSASKIEFLNEFVLNFPIEVISTEESNGVTWKYITPENFKKLPPNIQSSAAFGEFAKNKAEYFFLRRPINDPK